MSNNTIPFIEQLIKAGEYEKAETACIELLDENENNADSFSKLGEIYLHLGKEVEAQIFFEKALKVNPDHKQSKKELGLLNLLFNETQNNSEKIVLDFYDKRILEKSFKAGISNNKKSLLGKEYEYPEINLSKIIPPKIKDDELYLLLIELSKSETIKHVLEIGSSSGEGSTDAFVKGISQNKNHPFLYCMEIDKDRFHKLQNTYRLNSSVRCYNVSSVPHDKLLSDNEVRQFYKYKKTNLNKYSIDLVLKWLTKDKENIQKMDDSVNGIEEIMQDNNIRTFDMVLIDGSAFSAEAELLEIYGAEIIVLDDINDIKNYNNYHRLLADLSYELIQENTQLRNGYAVFKRVKNNSDSNKSRIFSIIENHKIKAIAHNTSQQQNKVLEDFSFKFEEGEQKLVKELVKKGMCIFDVGANVGEYTKLFSVQVGETGKVYAFEPSLQTFKTLGQEKDKYNLQNVFLENAAVYSENTKLKFNEFDTQYSAWNSIGHPIMEDPNDSQKIVPIVKSSLVRAIKLDSFCSERNIDKIDYLKIDVEGAEIFVLKGARELLVAKKIKYLQFEISQKMLEGLNTNAVDVFVFLKSMGYECHKITNEGMIGEKVFDSSSFYENYIAFPSNVENKKNYIINDLPVNFFSIVLNGKPFIDYHINIFKELPFKWHWHIIEGVAELNRDTAWSLPLGGKITEELHNNGLSNDGTSEYIDEIKNQYPENISVYRKSNGAFWDGKLEMVNVPLKNIKEECLLWQVDIDEFWTTEQIITMQKLFLEKPDKKSAYYYCYYFVGPNKYVSSINTWATYPSDWIRTWRFKPSMKWIAHEPPILIDLEGNNVGILSPLTRDETILHGISFQHFAYTTRAQVRFKEVYYGYKDAVKQWYQLQQTTGQVNPAYYLSWANNDATVNDWSVKNGRVLFDFSGMIDTPRKYSSMAVEELTMFESELRNLFNETRPKSIIETGTYLGRGTSTIIWRALCDLGINSDFTTIEVNPDYHKQAKEYFETNGMNVRAVLGLSIPRKNLPNKDLIEEQFVIYKESEGIYYDHKEEERSQLYFAETDFDVPDKILYYAMERLNFRPEFVLLDSAGHIGFAEFEYFLSLIQSDCYLMLDDVYHCKHFKTLNFIKTDPRFTILIESQEKFGFCIAKYSPDEIVYSDNSTRFNEKEKIYKSNKKYLLEAEVAINNNNQNEARRLLTHILRTSTNNIDAKNDLAVVDIIEHNYSDASNLLEEIIQIEPTNSIALDNKVILKKILGEHNISLPLKITQYDTNKDIRKPSLINGLEFQINFDLNDGCNLNCIMCGNVPNRNYKTQNVMVKRNFEERCLPIFRFANDFQFGCFFEPLMVPYFEEAVWKIKNYLKPGKQGTIISNGMMLTQSKIETMIDADIFRRIRFSIDSTSEELFGKIRSGAKLYKLLEHIKNLIKYRNSQRSKSRVEFNFTIMKDNIHELPDLVRMAREYGIDSITTHKLAPDDVLFVDAEYYLKLTNYLDEAYQLAKDFHIEFAGQTYITKAIYEATIQKVIKKDCGYFKKKYMLLIIDSYGNINTPCFMTDRKLGNLFENNFEDIISSNAMRKLFRSIKNPDSNICVNCGMFI